MLLKLLTAWFFVYDRKTNALSHYCAEKSYNLQHSFKNYVTIDLQVGSLFR